MFEIDRTSIEELRIDKADRYRRQATKADLKFIKKLTAFSSERWPFFPISLERNLFSRRLFKSTVQKFAFQPPFAAVHRATLKPASYIVLSNNRFRSDIRCLRASCSSFYTRFVKFILARVTAARLNTGWPETTLTNRFDEKQYNSANYISRYMKK